jgi:hypothetical protein
MATNFARPVPAHFQGNNGTFSYREPLVLPETWAGRLFDRQRLALYARARREEMTKH